MIKLRVVGTSPDQAELVLSNKPSGRKGSHSVAIDKRLLKVLQDAVYARRDAARGGAEEPVPPTEPKLAPPEMQRLLRSGTSLKQVAQVAEVDVAYVEQFYPPVLYERAGVISDAKSTYQEKPRLGMSRLPLGEAVAVNIARRVRLTDDMLADAWSATRRDGLPWTVTLTFSFRGRSRKASWKFDQRTRELTPANKLAADLGWVQGTGRALRAPSGGSGEPKKPAAKKPPARKAAAKRPAARRRSR